MNTTAYIPGLLTANQAARILDVSAHQIASLVRAGEFQAIATAGGAWLVSAESVQRYKQLYQGKGRPLNEDIAQAALLLLSKEEAETLTYQQRRRLHQRLRTITAEDLVWQTRKRARVRRYRCSPSFLKALSKEVALSGLNALCKNFDITNETDEASEMKGVEGYIDTAKLPELIKRYCLEEDARGRVTLRVVQGQKFNRIYMPIGFVAADLSESLNTREHRAGIDKLKGLLNEYRNL